MTTPPQLTLRERQVLTIAARGLTTREIADRLHLGFDTTKDLLRSAYRKLGVRRRLPAINTARHLGLLLTSERDLDAQPPRWPAGAANARIDPIDLHLIVKRWHGRAPAALIGELRHLIDRATAHPQRRAAS
ncbi:regulatory protein, luxR family [Pseudonocardia thermophila]|uniref:Regulatory protein, luxR family n=1 Tax=Pseudonocardia thermophila TaxID=1848 RepID=A0A1M7AXA1_PSETH|nr:helix-turn-helix transcriptional regulator [Pseudonocardia thermophila]SHL47277.1 regulatory protein, luxR family [Pseudonocardia thermophila]